MYRKLIFVGTAIVGLVALWVSPLRAQTLTAIPTVPTDPADVWDDLEFNDAANPRAGIRNYSLHVPPGYAHGSGTEHRFVLLLHGALQDLPEFLGKAYIDDFITRADANDVILVAPEGFLESWNAAHCCGFAKIYDIDDVAFIENLVNELVGTLDIDQKHIHMVGYSDGGMMVHRLAGELSDLFASGASVAAAAGGFLPSAFAVPACDPYDAACSDWTSLMMPPAPAEPMPLMMIRGMTDTTVPHDGGVGPSELAWHVPAVSNVASPGDTDYEFWTGISGCAVQPVDYSNPQGELRDCLAGGPGQFDVRMVSLTNMAHAWPTKSSLANFDAVKHIVRFLNQHPKP